MFHSRSLIFWKEENVHLQFVPPGWSKNRTLLFYVKRKSRALLFHTWIIRNPAQPHHYSVLCNLAGHRNGGERQLGIQQCCQAKQTYSDKDVRLSWKTTEGCSFTFFKSVEGATRWQKSGWCVFLKRPLCCRHLAASFSKLPVVIGMWFEMVNLFT